MKKIFALFLMICCFLMGHANAATLIVTGGNLTGANGVIINGNIYNVEFLDGECSEIFSGCDDESDFLFQTGVSSLAASQALLNQVFINGPLGAFGSSPGATRGCTSSFACQVVTPFALNPTPFSEFPIFQSSAFNCGTNTECGSDFVALGAIRQGFNSINASEATFARFTLAGAVPEPSTWLMMIVGLGLIGATLRLNKRESSSGFAFS